MKCEYKFLQEIATTSSGGTPSRTNNKYWGGNIPWIKSGQLKDGLIEACDEFITELGLKKSSTKLVKPDTLLLALYGATAGKLGFTKIEAATNQAVCAIVTNDNLVNKRYLFYFLLSIRSKILNDASGGAQPNISQAYVKNIKVPLPPLHIQQQIADTLDKADVLRRKDKELLDKYDELAQAVFYEMFGDPVRNEKGWMAKKLLDLSSHISSGSTPLGGQNVYIKEGVLFIRSQNVLMRKFDITDAAFISEDIHNKMKRTWVKANDVLLNITGASIGRVATYKGPDDKANVNQHVCIIRTKTEYLTPDFLMYLLSNNSYQSHIIGKSAGGTRESFTFSQIKNFDVILPPILQQLKFTKIIESIKRQAELSSESIEKSSQFFLSLMNSYFKN